MNLAIGISLISVEDISVESRSEDAGRKATLKLLMRWSREAAGKKLIEPRLKADLDVLQLQTAREKLE